MNWLWLIIVGVVLLVVAYYLARPDAPANPRILRWLLGLLGTICLVVGIIYFILWLVSGAGASGPPHAAGVFGNIVWDIPLLAGVINPVSPVTSPVDTDHDQQVRLRWWGMVSGWVLGLIAGAIGVIQKIGWGALGIGDITANWLLVLAGICVLISGAIASFPTFPDAARLRAERTLHWERKAARLGHTHVRLTED